MRIYYVKTLVGTIVRFEVVRGQVHHRSFLLFTGGKTTITDRDEVINFLEQTIDENIGLQSGVPVHITALDWTQDLSEFEQFDIILGADIVYIEDSFDDLLRTFVHLSRKDTVIYLSCRIRYERDNNFLTQMETKFYIEEILYDSTTDVKLYKAHKR